MEDCISGVRQRQSLRRDYMHLLIRLQSRDLCLGLVQLQTTAGHPVADQRDTVTEASHRVRLTGDRGTAMMTRVL